MALLVGVLLLLQSAPVQSEADKVEAALQNLGERTYRLLEKGKDAGTATLKTRVESEDGRKIVVLEDRFERKSGGRATVLAVTERAALDGLRLLSATRLSAGPDGKSETVISVRDGDAYVTAGERKLMIKTTQAAIGELAVPRLVCLQEQKVGSAFKADVLAVRAERLDEERDFRCVAQESVEVNGAKRDALKWEEKWEGKSTNDSKEPTLIVHNQYWISPEGILLRLKSGDLEMILESK